MYKILLIDDDQFLLFQYVETLKDYGFNVDSTIDIELFYSKAMNNDYDAIVCDIHLFANNFLTEMECMGGWRTGLALCKKIRFNGSDAKLIALTNSEHPEIIEWFSQDESVAYCHKRFYPPLEFAIALQNILDNPDCLFGELERAHTMEYRLSKIRNQIPNSEKIIIEKLDEIIESLETNNNKSFKSSVNDFISLISNITGILSSIPALKEIAFSLQNLISQNFL